jgi:hypothetical protein
MLQVVRKGSKKGSGIKTHPRTRELRQRKSHEMCFNCEELGHFAKDYEKVKQD